MKTNIEVPTIHDRAIEPGMAELTTNLNGQPFVIRGAEEMLTDMAAVMHRQDLADSKRQAGQKVVDIASKPLEIVSGKVSGFVGNIAANVAVEAKTMAFDVLNGTNLRAELHHQRKIRKVTDFAAGIGLLDIEPCAKHRKAMEKAGALV